MALLFLDGFDTYGTTGDVKTEVARLWTVPSDEYAAINIATARNAAGSNQKAYAVAITGGMSGAFAISRSISSKSGNKLFVTLSIKPTSSCVGRIYFGTDSYISFTESTIIVTYNSVDGSAHSVTTGTWITVELVLDATADAYQRLYVAGVLKEKRQVAPGIDSTISLSVDAGYTTPTIDDLIVTDGSGTAGNARLGPTSKVVTIIPTATVSNTFAGLTGAASAHAALANVPQLDAQSIHSNADAQAANVSLSNLTESPSVIAGVQITALLSNRDATGQGVSLATAWAAGSNSTATATPGETLEALTRAYSNRGDGTAISEADVTALAVSLTQT